MPLHPEIYRYQSNYFDHNVSYDVQVCSSNHFDVVVQRKITAAQQKNF